MSTLTGDGNAKCLGCSHQWSGGDSQPPEWFYIPQMQRQCAVGTGIFQYALFNHALCAADAFLRGLEDQFDRAVNLVAVSVQDARNRQADGGMSVVAAGVHYPRCLGCIFCAGFFLDG